MPLAFVLDEHLRGPLWQALLRYNLRSQSPLDVVCVGDSDELPLGAEDALILTWAEHDQRILVTLDRRTMPAHLWQHVAAGNHSPGVLIVRSDARVNELVDALLIAAHAGEPADFADQVTYIP